MELLVLIIAVGVVVLILALINAIHGALVKLNVKLWLGMNYPGAFRKAWPEDACNLAYTPKAVAMGIHPLLFIMFGILMIGISLISSSGAESRDFLQSAGEVMIAVSVIVFIIYVSKPLYRCLKQSLTQGAAQDVYTNLQEPLEMTEILKAEIRRGDAGEMLPFYRVWNAFFVHDMLTERMRHLGFSIRARDGIPPEAAEDIRDEIRQVSEAYESSLGSEKIPGKIKKEIKRRYKQLSKFSRYKVAEEEKIVFDCTACGQKLSVEEKYSGTEQNCPCCDEKLYVPRPEEPPDSTRKAKQVASVIFILSALLLLTGLISYESSWGPKAAEAGIVCVFISFILLALTFFGGGSSEREKQ